MCLRTVRRASVYLTRFVGKASYSCGSGEGMKFKGGMDSVIERKFRRIWVLELDVGRSCVRS